MKFKTLLLTAIISFSANAAEPKEDPNAQPSGGQFLGAGGGVGPDLFGYTGTDSNTGACSTQFVDITGTGATITSGDDVAGDSALPTPFNFYGVELNTLTLNSNGFISTDPASAGDLSNDCPLPAAPSTGAGARMYAVHDDLISDVLYEYFPVCPRPSDNFPGQDIGCHVVQWVNVTHFGGADIFTFEAILYDLSWEIAFIQGAGNLEEGSGSTTGLQNEAATDGITYACDTAASIPAATAQCFTHPEPDGSLFPPISVPVNNKTAMFALMGVMALAAMFLFRRKLSA